MQSRRTANPLAPARVSRAPSPTLYIVERPANVSALGRRAAKRFDEFFTAKLRSANTREAYHRAAMHFFNWCDAQGLAIPDVDPPTAAAYVETLRVEGYKPRTIKQHLSALRRLFNYMVEGGTVEFNPFAPVEGPKVRQRGPGSGRTKPITRDDVKTILEAIDTSTAKGKRDHAIISLMFLSFARVSAIARLTPRHFEVERNGQARVELHEKGGVENTIPVHHAAWASIVEYMDAAGLDPKSKAPLFQSSNRWGQLTGKAMHRNNILDLVKNLAANAGIKKRKVGCHTFRATGITEFRKAGGSRHVAQQIAGHADPRTTDGYDHSDIELQQSEIERIQF